MQAGRRRILSVLLRAAAALLLSAGWQTAHSSPGVRHIASSPVWGDLDGDGRPDQLVIRREADASRIEVLASSARVSQTLSTDSAASTVIAVDIDGDGDLDLITASPTGSELWLNDGHGVFTPGRTGPSRALSAPIAVDSAITAELAGLIVGAPQLEPAASSLRCCRAAFLRFAPPVSPRSSPAHASSLLRAPPARPTLS